jgi:N utilization substance protein B
MVDTSTLNARGRGRELALAVLCHLESYPEADRAAAVPLVLDNPPVGDDEGEDAFARLAADSTVRSFAAELLHHVESKRAEIDALIGATSQRWRLERMDRVDRNVIRLAVAELRGLIDTPRAVVLAESVRLASRYGNERSGPFVNGLVEALAQRLRGKEDHD